MPNSLFELEKVKKRVEQESEVESLWKVMEQDLECMG